MRRQTELSTLNSVYAALFILSTFQYKYNSPIPLDINECASQPCQNGGKCEDFVNAYLCKCPKGYVGKNCETSKRNFFVTYRTVLSSL